MDEKNYLFLKNFVIQKLSHLTFSDIWLNANYDLFNEFFLPTLRETKKNIILITNPKATLKDLKQLVDVKELIPIKGNCVTYWEKHRGYLKGLFDLKASLIENSLFLVAAGPLSNIIIYEMWNINRNNIYLDIGSTLDPLIFHRQSRDYHKEGHPHRKLVDKW